jgi:branched-chain amino acid transport system substrate-binding protein
MHSLAMPALIAAVLGIGSAIAHAAEPYNIPVILPLTGGGAYVGNGVKNDLAAVEIRVNADGGIRGQPVHFAFYDDETSPQRDVQIANDLLSAKPSVILGPLIVAMCNAVAPLLSDGPVMYCLSPAFRPAAGSYTFSASTSINDLVAAVVRYYRLKGWTRIAVLNGTDNTGQSADQSLDLALALPENATMTKVEHQHFNIADISVAAQIERIKASGAQALIAWTTGAPLATILKGMIQAGLDIPIAPSSGNEVFAQMEQYAAFLPKQLVLPSSLAPEHDGVLSLDPRVEKVQHDMYATLKERGLRADVSTATGWDSALIVVAALRALGPSSSAAQIRDYIANLSDFAGVNGIYDFRSHPGRGLGRDSATLVRYDPEGKSWVWLAQPGGAPLGQ